MRIDIAGEATPPSAPAPARIMESWQVGQILNAMLISTDTRGTVTLKVNEALIQAHIQPQPNQPLPTLSGQPLQLQVTSTGAQTVLKVINLPVKNDPIAQALRTALPRQADLTPLLTNIALLADPAVNKISSPLPQPIIQLAQQLFNNLTSTTQAATTAGLQHAVNNSGLFLESKLTHTVMANFEPRPSLSLDFKVGLLLLRNALAAPTPVGQPQGAPQAPHNTVPESPVSGNMRAPAIPSAPAVASLNPAGLNTALELTSPALAMQIEGALARLQVNQISSLPNPQQPLWVIELPLRHGNGIDLVALHIEQDANPSTPESPERPWCISLELAPGDLGPLHVRITLLGQQVSVTLWAEENTTAALANHNIGQLQDNLIQAGFNPGIVHCQQGKPPTILRRDALPGGTHSLVDTHA